MAGKRILLAWENGAGLGHAKRLLRMAVALRDNGFDPVVAARDISAAQRDYRDAGIPILQAPRHRGFQGDPKTWNAQSYADLMASCAWDDAEALEQTVFAWDGLLDLLRPALVIADFCPILPLATLGRIPTLVVGDGFVVPPREGEVLPVIRDTKAPRADDANLRANGEAVLVRRGRPRHLPSLGALMNADRSIVCTYPELDVYADYRNKPASGSLETAFPLPPPKGQSLFVYLAADYQDTEKALDGASLAGMPIRAFVRSARPAQRDAWRARGMFIHDEAPPLLEELHQASAIMHHGGIGTAELALATGRAQLLVPRHLEQTLNAKRLGTQGVAARLAAPFKPEDATAAVRHVCGSTRLHAKVTEVAEQIAARPGSVLSEIVATASEMVR
ncbi:nucleotide disphospho-sugar-binding domain-containing protein [Devosia sp. 1566]|uniref:glycosyltransferase n=1 Tax=Devosia sp. 1566 TaxID=2499144 RepID=UPI000FD788E7|nr:nucleotide disphospho-sugar-binding domain-containing protein [Devosia sp. 1566]